MAIKIGKSSNPTAGAVKTPAPDSVTHMRDGGNGFGQNGFTGASSVNPGKRVVSPLAANMESSVDDSSFGEVLGKGSGNGDDVLNKQVRQIAKGNVPPAFGMKNPNANNPKVPAASHDGDKQGLKKAMGFAK